MAIQRWDPLRDLLSMQERMNRLFDEALARSSGLGDPDAVGAGWKPPMDLHEESGRYVLRADLPGIEAADVDIQVEDGRLVLRGERRMDPGVDREAYLRVERPYGRFLVQVALPPSINAQEVRASHRNGVLEISLPKKKEQASARVPVKGE